MALTEEQKKRLEKFNRDNSNRNPIKNDVDRIKKELEEKGYKQATNKGGTVQEDVVNKATEEINKAYDNVNNVLNNLDKFKELDNKNRNPIKGSKEVEIPETYKKANFNNDLQEVYNQTFGERLVKGGQSIVTDLASVPFQAFDIAKEAYAKGELGDAVKKYIPTLDTFSNALDFTSYLANQIDPNLKEFKATDEDNLSNKLNQKAEELHNEALLGTEGLENVALNTLIGAGNMASHLGIAYATGGAINPVLTMAVQSGTDKTYQNLQEGYDMETSLGNGLLTGAVTAITEKLGLDRLTKIATSGLGQFALSAYVTNCLSESFEEGIEYTTGYLLDKAMLGKEEDYNTGELFMSMLYGFTVSGLMTGGAEIKYHVDTKKTYNKLKADMDTLVEYQQTNELTEEENSVINTVLNTAQQALNKFDSTSVLGNAVNFESDQVTRTSAQEIIDNYNKFTQPDVDKNNKFEEQQNTVKNVLENSQKVLSQKGINMDVVQYSNLDNETKAQVDKVQGYANDLGVKVVFDSNMDTTGMYYDGRIYINPTSELAPLTTFVHELTHGTESSRYYTGLKQLILSDKDNLQLSKDLKYIKDRYQANGITLDEEGVMQEYVAIQTQELLNNEEFVERLVRYNNSLASRIYEGIKDIVLKTNTMQKIEYNFMRAFANNGYDSEGSYYQTEDLVDIDEKGGSVAPKFSLGTWTNTNKEQIVTDLVKNGIAENDVVAEKWVNDVSGVAKIIANNKILLDYEASPHNTMMKPNSEYIYTIDASTNCKKRIPLSDTIDAIQKNLPNTVLTGDDYIKIRQMMTEEKHGKNEVSCGFCYVESRRKDLGKVAEKFLQQYGDTSLTIYDLITDEGSETLRRIKPEAYEAFVKFNKKRGSGSVKLVESRTEYRGEIMKLTPATVNKINEMGGFRLQSYSDFETPHLIDMMQVIVDMSRKGLTSQAYTKVPNFADAFGNTGVKINLSLVTKGLDKNGNLIFDDVEGMPHKQAFALRNKYSDNVGTILVGKDDATILSAMADERIDFIIPYHRSGWAGKEYEALGITGYKDYTAYQKEYWIEPKIKNGKKETAPQENLHPKQYWDYSKTGKENAETYLRLCAEEGRRPKFYNFLVENGDGSYSLQQDGSTDGYWKTLIDFKMYNNEGVGVPQNTVKPIFDNDVNQRILNEYDGSHRRRHAVQSVVDEFVKSKAQYSVGLTKDSLGRDLTKEQQEYFKDSKVRDKNGNLMTVYHGTPSHGFTIFDANKSDDKLSFFFTDNREMAQSYVNDDTKEYEVYLNLTNPLEVDARGNNWNNIKFGKLDDENLRNVDRFLDLNRNYYAPLSIYEFVESLGGLEEGVEYMISETEEDLKAGEENPYFTKEEKDELYELARKIDDAYNNWNDSDHLDEYGDETPFANYILDNQIKSLNTRQVSWKAKKEGHDGVIIKNLKDNGKFANARGTWSQGDVYIAFDSNQIKNVNNTKPTTNKDIRYSIGLTDEDLSKGLEAHDQALDQYGAFEEGEIPVRNVEIAQETDFGKTNRFARTIAESSSVTDEQVDLLKAKIGQGQFAYQPISNEQLQERATDKINKVGIEQAIEDYLQYEGYSSSSIAEGELLLDQISRSGDNDTAMKLASKLASQLTEAGRAVQAARLLKRLTPQGQLVHTERTITKLQDSLNKRYGEKAPQLEINDELKQRLLNAKTDDEMGKVLEEISLEVGKQIPSTLMDQLNTWRYLAMLGNPRTHIRNTVGNFVSGLMVSMKNNIGTVLEASAQKVGLIDTRTKTILNPLDENDKALIEFAKNNFNEYKSIFEKSGKYDLAELIEKNRDVYSNDKAFGRLLNKLVKTNSGALEWEDMFFSKSRYASSLAQYMKANKLTQEDVGSKEFVKGQEYAYKESLKQTFRDNNALADAIGKFAKTNKATQFAMDAILPFKKTPMNIVKRGVEYSPIGLLTSITKGSYDLKNGKITANEFIDGLASGLTGTGVTLLGLLLANIGLFRTKDDDKDRKQYYDEDLGEQDYAIVLPHGTYTVDWLSPTIMPLAIGAELQKGLENFNGIDDVVDIASKITEPIFETSMLSGLTSSLQSFASGQEGAFNMIQNALSSYVNQYFPTLFGQIARSIDDTRRTTYPNDGAVDKTMKQIANKIPGLTYTNEPYINRKGEEQKQEGSNIFTRMMLNMLSPGYYKSYSQDEYDDELLRLYNNDPANVGVLPSSTSKQVTHEKQKYDLKDEAYTNFHETRYSLERYFTNDFIDSDAYQFLDDSERISIISKMREYAGMEAKKQYLDSIGMDYTDSEYIKTRGALDAGMSLHEYYMARTYYNKLSGKTKKSDYVDYLLDSGLGKESMNYLYDLYYTKGSVEDYSGSTTNGSKESNKTRVSSKKPKTTKTIFTGDLEKDKAIIDNMLAKVYSSSSSKDAYERVNSIINNLTKTLSSADIKKSDFSSIIKKYLEDHPYDATLFD